MLLRHVETEVIKGINRKGSTNDIQYDVSVVTVVDSAIVKFGSSHIFTNPLFEARISQFSINASGLFSSHTGWFVPEKESINHEDDGKLENQNGNHIHFESSIRYGSNR